jgi:hypothetical protein
MLRRISALTVGHLQEEGRMSCKCCKPYELPEVGQQPRPKPVGALINNKKECFATRWH